MYYGTQLGPMWGIERIAAAGLGARPKRRAIVAAALLLSSLVTVPGAAASDHSAAARAAAFPALAPGLAADSVWVTRLDQDPSRAGSPAWRPASSALASPADARRLGALLGSVELNRADGRMPRRCRACAGRMQLEVHFDLGAKSLEVELWFPERVAFFSGDGFVVAGFCDSIAAPLLEVARHVLASDTVLAGYAVPAVDWGAAGDPTVARLESTTVVMPAAVFKALPRYPDAALRRGVSGLVMVVALVGRDGEVKDARIRDSIPLLDDEALDTVRRWRFKPATMDGQPVAVWVAVPVRFTLH